MKKKIGIYMPGRLNSERLPNKLTKQFDDGNCLWEIACRKLNYIGKNRNVAVLSSDEPLKEIWRKYPNVTHIQRSEDTTQVDGPLKFIFKDVQKWAEEQAITHLMFLNPCLYNLSIETIEDSIEFFEQSEAECATSVKPFQNWLWEKDPDLTWSALVEPDFKTLSTKDVIQKWQAAHCFHIFNVEAFFENGQMLDEDMIHIPVPKEETLDVDDATDFMVANELRKKLYKTYVVDIDGTICTQREGDYNNAAPIEENIRKLQKLHAEGHLVKYFTARGTGTGVDWKATTLAQLDRWKCPNPISVQFGKPAADVYIDDRALNACEVVWK